MSSGFSWGIRQQVSERISWDDDLHALFRVKSLEDQRLVGITQIPQGLTCPVHLHQGHRVRSELPGGDSRAPSPRTARVTSGPRVGRCDFLYLACVADRQLGSSAVGADFFPDTAKAPGRVPGSDAGWSRGTTGGWQDLDSADRSPDLRSPWVGTDMSRHVALASCSVLVFV